MKAYTKNARRKVPAPPLKDTARANADELEREFLQSLDDDERVTRLLENGRDDGPVNCVYFVRLGATDAVKIGRSSNIVSRLAALQTSSPLPLYVCAYVNFPSQHYLLAAEASAHRAAEKLSSSSLHGEWFHLSSEQVAEVAMKHVVQEHRTAIGAFVGDLNAAAA